MTVLGDMIIEASRSCRNQNDVSIMFETVTGIRPVMGTPAASMRRGIKNALDQMSHRDITLKYDSLKQLQLL